MMAFQCATETTSYHVNAELVVLEVLDSDNRPVLPGKPGRVVITPLFNAAQPLIRYEQGDIAVPGTSCACGCSLPVLSELRGRVDDLFHLPVGVASFANLNEKMLQETLQADALQFAQVAPEHIVVRYVAPKTADEAAKAAITASVRELLNYPAMNVSFQQLDDIPANEGGKQQRIKREFDLS